ncbi:MAG TPA: patatin-like phospholipase family protein [Thermoanaerobaculia bacterium]|jgi:predicted acylesterase/phospholipase RssA|nr:patatin-like phospholipase family protein [Thermoanaerobaculia bacterium]
MMPATMLDQPPEGSDDTGPGLAGDIALCLSGGGYRAAAFHLGVLDLLDRVALLPKVRTLSTISGGTIVGAAWALSCARRESFGAFYARAWETLRSLNVVKEAVARLAARGPHDPSASLIRAAARVYAGSPLYGDAKLGELIDSPHGPDELIFSATEFHSGRAYRFQTSRRTRVKVGNLAPLEIPAAVAREVRIADVVAASSCFPGAFEPLVFPRDFAWSDAAAVREQLGGERFPPVPLMDGGIYDNQGVDGALTVYERAGMFDQLGLLLVSDTSKRREPLFAEPKASGLPGMRMKTVARLARVGFWLALLSFVAVLYPLVSAPWAGAWTWKTLVLLLFTSVVPAVLAGGTTYLLWRLRRAVARQMESIRADTGVDLPPLLAGLRLRDVGDLASRRIGSVLAMVNDVSMKRVRRLIQQSLLGEGSRYQRRARLVLIYDVDARRSKPRERHPDLLPSLELQLLSRRAEAVPTTLWADEEQLRDFVACGQATACLKLLEHLRERRAAALATPGSAEATLEAALLPLWATLQDNPYALLQRSR